MAKVVLVWNEHPTEVVAGFHARKVAKILREKYRHKVIVEKVSIQETGYGQIRRIGRGAKAEAVAKELLKMKSSLGTAAKSARKYRAPAFNFHASNHVNLGSASTKSPEEFNIEEVSPRSIHLPGALIRSEIIIQRFPNANHFVIEVPASYEIMKTTQAEKHRAQARQVFNEISAMKRNSRVRIAESETTGIYNWMYTPLNTKEQQKYLHPVITT